MEDQQKALVEFFSTSRQENVPNLQQVLADLIRAHVESVEFFLGEIHAAFILCSWVFEDSNIASLIHAFMLGHSPENGQEPRRAENVDSDIFRLEFLTDVWQLRLNQSLQGVVGFLERAQINPDVFAHVVLEYCASKSVHKVCVVNFCHQIGYQIV